MNKSVEDNFLYRKELGDWGMVNIAENAPEGYNSLR